MDHLLYFDANYRIDVPFVCSEMYDGLEFATYPQRKGWKFDRLWYGDLQGGTLLDAASFLQTWLYFGALFHVLAPIDPSFDPGDFIETRSNGKKFISTAKLPEYVLKWEEVDRSRTKEQHQERHKHINALFVEMNVLTSLFCRGQSMDPNGSKDRYYLPAEIGVSVIMLLDSITKAGFTITGIPFNYDWHPSELLIEQMKAHGWCPSAIETLRRGQQVHNLYSASTLGPPPVVEDHTTCTNMLCKKDQIGQTETTTRSMLSGAFDSESCYTGHIRDAYLCRYFACLVERSRQS